MNAAVTQRDDHPQFGLGSAVLDYGVSANLPTYRSRLDMFWPAIAFQVIVSTRSERSLNVFQEVVLRLARAGITSRSEIAEQSCLKPGLVKVITVQLHTMGLLAAGGLPTGEGEKLLDDARDYEETTTGYVFRDAWEGQVLPRFMAGSLPAFDVEVPIRQGRRLVISGLLGTAGKPWNVREAEVFHPPVISPRAFVPPTAHQVRKAIRGHARDWRIWRSGRDMRGEGVTRLPGSASMVRVAPRAEPVLLAMVAVTTETNDEHRRFETCDPCGLGTSDLMQALVTRSVSHEGCEHLADAIRRLVARAHEGRLGDKQRAILERREQATGAVLSALGGRAPTVVHEALTTMEIDHADPSAHPHVSAYNASVRILEDVVQQVPPRSGSAGFADDGRENSPILSKASQNVGFVDDTLQPLLPMFFVVNGRRLKTILNGEPTSLDAVCGLLVYEAQRDTSHPLRRLAKEWPDALVFLALLKEDRKLFAHGDRSVTNPVLDREAVVEGVYRIATVLLAGRVESAAVAARVDKSALRVDAVSIVRGDRIIAATDVVMAFGPGIETDRALCDNLRTLVFHARAVEQLLACKTFVIARAVIQPHLSNAVLAASAAAECTLAPLLALSEPLRLKDIAGDGGLIDNEQVDSAIRAAGFEIPDPLLLRSLHFVRQDFRAKAVAHGECKSLGAAIIGLLLREQAVGEGILHEVAKLQPNFLCSMCHLIKCRGHDGAVELNPVELGALRDTVITSIKTLRSVDQGVATHP